MKIFFDTEFTGLHKDTTLISIGMVAENGKKFYAESTDYCSVQCNDWIQDNVLSHTILQGNEEMAKELGEDANTTVVIGCSENIRHEVSEWMSQFEYVEFVSDVCHYDFVLLIDIFGIAFDLPKQVCPACYDINQDIARHYGISASESFDKSREDIVAELCGKPIVGTKHNALYDAEVIKAIYEEISS